MDNIKVTITAPWLLNDGTYGSRVSDEKGAYAVPLVYRATRLRCNSLTRVPVYIFNEKDEEVRYYFEDQMPMRQLLWMSEAALLLDGWNFLLKLKNKYRYGKGLQWLNPFTMQSELTRDQTDLLFWQQVNAKRYPAQGFWERDDFIYMREFNPADDLGRGVSAARVALKAAEASYNTDTFLSNFFGSDAVPVTLVTAPNMQRDQADKLENWFKKKLRAFGKKDTEKVIGVSGEVKVEKLTAELNTFDFPAIDAHVLEQVSHAFDIPKTLLSANSANYATAQVERRVYMEDTIIPRCKMFEEALNPFLAEVGQRIEFAPQELPEMQEDEKDRATSLGGLVNAGVPLRAALDILGYDLSEDAEKLIEQAEKDKMQGNKGGGGEQDVRSRIDAYGTAVRAGVVTPTIEDEKAVRSTLGLPEVNEKITGAWEEDGGVRRPITLGKPPQSEIEEGAGTQPPQLAPQLPPNNKQVKADLDKWFRKAISSMKAGNSPAVEFESDYVPNEMKSKILIGLREAKTECDTRKVFETVTGGQ